MKAPRLAATVALIATALPCVGVARADDAALREARRLIEVDVRYDRAQAILTDALRAGDNDPDQLAAIYELAGITAVVLGQEDVGEQYFARMLALRPSALLPPDTSPKILTPFGSAQARMAALGSLRVSVRAATTGEVAIDIVSDPLGMIAGAQLEYRDRTGARAVVASPARAAVSPVVLRPPPGTIADRIVVVDEYGNVLYGERLLAAPTGERTPASADTGDGPSFWRWPYTWAIASGACAGVAIGFGLDARSSHADLDAILADPSHHTYDDAEAARSRWRLDAAVADVGFAAAGALAITAVVVWATGRRDRHDVAIAPWTGAGVAGVSLAGAL